MYASFEKIAIAVIVFVVSIVVGSVAFDYFTPSDEELQRDRRIRQSLKQKDYSPEFQRDFDRQNRNMMQRMQQNRPNLKRNNNSSTYRRNGGSGKIGRVD